MAICQNAPDNAVAAAITSMTARLAEGRLQPADDGDNGVDFCVGDELEGAHRVNRDVPFEVERGLGEQVAESAPSGECAGERGQLWRQEPDRRGSQASLRSAPDHSRQSSAVRRRNISSRVSK